MAGWEGTLGMVTGFATALSPHPLMTAVNYEAAPGDPGHRHQVDENFSLPSQILKQAVMTQRTMDCFDTLDSRTGSGGAIDGSGF